MAVLKSDDQEIKLLTAAIESLRVSMKGDSYGDEIIEAVERRITDLDFDHYANLECIIPNPEAHGPLAPIKYCMFVDVLINPLLQKVSHWDALILSLFKSGDVEGATSALVIQNEVQACLDLVLAALPDAYKSETELPF